MPWCIVPLCEGCTTPEISQTTQPAPGISDGCSEFSPWLDKELLNSNPRTFLQKPRIVELGSQRRKPFKHHVGRSDGVSRLSDSRSPAYQCLLSKRRIPYLPVVERVIQFSMKQSTSPIYLSLSRKLESSLPHFLSDHEENWCFNISHVNPSVERHPSNNTSTLKVTERRSGDLAKHACAVC